MSENRQLEEGELEQGDSKSPMKTPLGALHDKKMSVLRAETVQDSLQRPRKRKMKPVEVESDSDSDVCSSKGFEDSVMEGLKRHKSSEISLRQSGLLERKQFMSKFSIPDRRDLKGISVWMQGLNELFSTTRLKGGEHFKEFYQSLKMHAESVEMYFDEYQDEPKALDGLEVIQAVLKMFLRILDIHSTSNGLGSKLVATVSTSEVGLMIGALEASFIVSSLRSQSRGVSGSIFHQSPYKLATWVVRQSRPYTNYNRDFRQENRWPHGGKKTTESNNKSGKSSGGSASGLGKNSLPRNKF